MKYTVRKSFIQVIGKLWMGGVAAMEYTIRQSDIENMIDDDNDITRASIENWLGAHSGDFSNITDFNADLELTQGSNLVAKWVNEESEFIYNDCMFGSEIE